MTRKSGSWSISIGKEAYVCQDRRYFVCVIYTRWMMIAFFSLSLLLSLYSVNWPSVKKLVIEAAATATLCVSAKKLRLNFATATPQIMTHKELKREKTIPVPFFPPKQMA